MRANGDDKSRPGGPRQAVRLRAAEHLLSLIDRLAAARVLVFGSLPPEGRDLDLLVRPPEHAALSDGLAAEGFIELGAVFARFRDCSAEVVELMPAHAWRLPAAELAALFDESEPLEGCVRATRPAPHHALLVLARRAVGEGATLRPRHHARIAALIGADPDVFERARASSDAWRASKALEMLEDAYRRGERLVAPRRLRAAIEIERGGRGRLRSYVAALRRVGRRPRIGSVVAFSGLDGCGKSTQANSLRQSLARLGYDAEVVWSSVASHPAWLGSLARLATRVLALIAPTPAMRKRRDRAPSSGSIAELQKAVRRKSGAVTYIWSLIVTTRAALESAGAIWPAVLRGKVVIRDRSLLDAIAYLRYQYGEAHRFGSHMAVLRLASPPARLTFFLDLEPRRASERDPEYDVTENARRAAIYRVASEQLGAQRVDADRPRDQICADVARMTWLALARRKDGRRLPPCRRSRE